MLANARRAYARLTLAPLPAEGSLTIVATPEEAVEGAGFVQESAPEREGLKRELLAAASRAAAPDVPFASSTSGLLPSRLAADMRHPERLVVGHPFNPVYLLPLVEVCGGAPEARERAAALYRQVGMRPLILRREVDGFVADRLLEALWREALWLVHDDVATVAEIDDAIRFGAGLRWAFMGTFLTYRIGGGEQGMRHFLEQFGPTLALPWTKLMDVPELGDGLLDKLVAQSEEQAAGRSIRELEQARDDCLVAIIQGLRAQGAGAGAVLAEYERGLLGRSPDDEVGVHAARVLPEWVDYNGHMHESRYLQLFGDATDALLRHLARRRLAWQLLHGRDPSLAPAGGDRGRARPGHDPAARPRREAPAPLPRAAPRRRAARDRRADAPARGRGHAAHRARAARAAGARGGDRRRPRAAAAARARRPGDRDGAMSSTSCSRPRAPSRATRSGRSRSPTTRARSTRASWSSGRPRSGSRATTCPPSTAAAASRAWPTSCA